MRRAPAAAGRGAARRMAMTSRGARGGARKRKRVFRVRKRLVEAAVSVLWAAAAAVVGGGGGGEFYHRQPRAYALFSGLLPTPLHHGGHQQQPAGRAPPARGGAGPAAAVEGRRAGGRGFGVSPPPARPSAGRGARERKRPPLAGPGAPAGGPRAAAVGRRKGLSRGAGPGLGSNGGRRVIPSAAAGPAGGGRCVPGEGTGTGTCRAGGGSSPARRWSSGA